MPILMFVKRGKRLGEFLTSPYTVSDSVLNVSALSAYVSSLSVRGVSSELRYSAQFTPSTVCGAYGVSHDEAVTVHKLSVRNSEDVDAYLVVLPAEQILKDVGSTFTHASILVDAEIAQNAIETFPLSAVEFEDYALQQANFEVTDLPAYVEAQLLTLVDSGMFRLESVAALKSTSAQDLAQTICVPVVEVNTNVPASIAEHSATSIKPDRASVSYTLFWLPPVPIHIEVSSYAVSVEQNSRLPAHTSPIGAPCSVRRDSDSAWSPSQSVKRLSLVHRRSAQIVQTPSLFRTAISLKVKFPESGTVESQAYSDYIAMTIQGDTNPVGANDKNSAAVMLSLSTETNAVSSAASA